MARFKIRTERFELRMSKVEKRTLEGAANAAKKSLGPFLIDAGLLLAQSTKSRRSKPSPQPNQ